MIVVNPATRQFNIPGADLVFGVTADANSAIKHFQCPRYVGNNVDIASSFVRINYQNAHGDIDFYLVKDVTVDGENVTFSWELHPKVTMYKGNVSFVMCVTGPDMKVKWHTTLGRGQVLEGLESDSTLVEGDTKDGIAALIAMVEAQTEAVADTGAEWVRNVQLEGTDQIIAAQTAAKESREAAVAEIEAKGASTLATIPGEYTATVNAVQSAANAIRGKVSGEVIRVDDVSPMEHYPKIRVHGKNLLPSAVMDMGNWSLVDGTRNNYFFPLNQLDDGKTYTISAEILDGSAGYFYLEESRDGFASNTDRHLHIPGTSRLPFTFTKEVGTDYRLFWHDINLLISDLATNIQLEEGTVATEYTPHIDPTTVKVKRFGKNLLDHTIMTDSMTHNGVTLTRTGDLLTLNGTLTADSVLFNTHFAFYGEEGVPYTFSYKYVSGELIGNASACVGASETKESARQSWCTVGLHQKDGDLMFWLDYPFIKDFWIYSYGGTVFKNYSVRVQLEKSRTLTGYESYTGETQIPTADGTVAGLNAVSPVMTLLTDTPGVTIDCEYSRDTNKVIEDILNKLAALVGNT